jgi:hypothetical protein
MWPAESIASFDPKSSVGPPRYVAKRRFPLAWVFSRKASVQGRGKKGLGEAIQVPPPGWGCGAPGDGVI